LNASFLFPSAKKTTDWHASTECAAKKKGGKGKKNKQPKQSGMDWAMDFKVKPYDSQTLQAIAETAVGTYQQATGKSLHATLSGAANAPKALWEAPVAVLVVSSKVDEAEYAEQAEGPLVEYANAAALEALGIAAPEEKFDDVVGQRIPGLALPVSLPSDKRYESGYSKKMLKSQGGEGGGARSVTLERAERWLLTKAAIVDGQLAVESVGVAYAFEEWFEDADGGAAADSDDEGDGSGALSVTVRKPGGVVEVRYRAEGVAAAVEAAAATVRSLKEEQGLGNSDPEVKAAVAELLRLKDIATEAAAA